LREITAGNPFFVCELVRHMAERGELDDFERMIASIETVPLNLPETLRRLLAGRLDRISDKTRDILRTAAIIGRSFPFALLELMSGAKAEELLDQFEEAEEADLITSALRYPEVNFHFAHELIRQAVLADLSAARQQRLHLQIADAIERLYANTLEDWSEDLAHHLWGAGLLAPIERTLRWVKTAARRATERGAHDFAVQYLSRGLEVVARMPQGNERMRQELRLNVRLIAPLNAAKGYTAPEVEAVCVRARELGRKLDNPPELFGILSGLFSIHFNREELRLALEVAEQMMGLATRHKVQHEILWANFTVGVVRQEMGDFTLARAHFTQVLELYEPGHKYGWVHDPGVTTRSYLAYAVSMLGYPDQGLILSQEAVVLARDLSHPYTLAMVLGHLGLALCAYDEIPSNTRLSYS